MALPTVTLSREQFHALLSRAQNCGSNAFTAEHIDPIKIITTAEWQRMTTAIHEYQRLRDFLLDVEGVTNETLDWWAKGQGAAPRPVSPPAPPVRPTHASLPFSPAPPAPHRVPLSTTTDNKPSKSWAEVAEFKPSSAKNEAFKRNNHQADAHAANNYDDDDSLCEGSCASAMHSQGWSAFGEEKPDTPATFVSEKEFKNDHGRRSILFGGLPEHTTLYDVANVIRGGMILNMYTRRDGAVHVSFVTESGATTFMKYAEGNHIYIRSKRVEVTWDEYGRYYLSGHTAHRIYKGGATRNLLICNVKGYMTASHIRADLKHIYRLQVLKITVEGNDLLVSLNSVNHAITAKTCMLSRFEYKKTRIDFAPDECDRPLPVPSMRRPLSSRREPERRAPANRFALLSLDEDEVMDDGVDDSDQESLELQEGEKNMTRWAENELLGGN